MLICKVWLDANTCGTSQVKAPSKTTFEIDTKPWTANFDGQVMGMGGHLHDGGTHAEIMWNGKIVCDSVATYGDSSLMQGGARSRVAVASKSKHISAMSYCLSMKEMKKGDKFLVRGYYDQTIHPMMKSNGGKLEDLMVISIFLVRVPIERETG
jgi:hypothetical protein